ncbi:MULTISPECIES: LacI family DNA-binding transcriptional regulator [Deinococcus]|uniref:Transcriptional regulator, LacI family n=1 Tax=Deinococcus geothermalis (strain DSM 11300 / CIP 105573 / AG-3a) TaxID=319795 RepID=Q1IW47_DEIGD|nr:MULTISPECIES: LacI family DNA-binding transcriptional regulator [Deinococcus]ABF46537.1 transcriptional regulator, LacI family [Deinococcus geothermalis DSM 11300]MBI0447235.1 LacI family DNA-binding transcriptional regulator [Deinococcus sp. DB0503]
MSPAKLPVRRVTLRDVAARLGVSPATVSNAYNRPDQLSPELRERVLRAAHELGYSGPNPLARSLRRGRTGVIGVVYDSSLHSAFADPAASLFLGGVARAVQDEGLNLLLLAAVRGAAPAVESASVDGLILYATTAASPALAAARTRALPAVLVDQAPQPGFPLIGIEDERGAEAAARHLLEWGHREIGVLALPFGPNAAPNVHLRARLHGYRRALRGSAGQLYIGASPDNSPESGERLTRELLAAQPQVTALLCMSDVLAQGALRAAAGAGLRVPGDLSVVGYDDIPSSTALNLTTVHQPTAEKGLEAGRAMLALLRGETPPSVTLPTRLVVRGSSGAP